MELHIKKAVNGWIITCMCEDEYITERPQYITERPQYVAKDGADTLALVGDLIAEDARKSAEPQDTPISSNAPVEVAGKQTEEVAPCPDSEARLIDALVAQAKKRGLIKRRPNSPSIEKLQAMIYEHDVSQPEADEPPADEHDVSQPVVDEPVADEPVVDEPECLDTTDDAAPTGDEIDAEPDVAVQATEESGASREDLRAAVQDFIKKHRTDEVPNAGAKIIKGIFESMGIESLPTCPADKIDAATDRILKLHEADTNKMLAKFVGE